MGANAESKPSSRSMWPSFIAGGAAGAAIIMQVQPSAKDGGQRAYPNVWRGLLKIWREEGFAGFMRGNGVNCIRIAPYAAVQFTTYEAIKRALTPASSAPGSPGAENAETFSESPLSTEARLAAGAAAGFASVVATYPLDLVRSRISIASASIYSSSTAGSVRVPGLVETFVKVFREEGGIRGLYRGSLPTSMGVAPYVACNFYFYENARAFFTRDGTPPSAMTKLMCGAWAGAISQVLTQPLDVLRRRMHVAGMADAHLGRRGQSAYTILRGIVQQNGFRGLYFGLEPNLLKVAPSMGTYFLTFEAVHSLIEPYFN
ncbi:hypothetical protein MCUN1_002984 [Malassezia cuniculi]|uniref:Mitochondrial carrier protein n=1 Tax=Malassezia cuniculi TaxID=948313 RepID=A0AAF0F0Q0_9BASI|nr:hypothetical protein MCUN1_002984 [Malassezia cuniculi]